GMPRRAPRSHHAPRAAPPKYPHPLRSAPPPLVPPPPPGVLAQRARVHPRLDRLRRREVARLRLSHSVQAIVIDVRHNMDNISSTSDSALSATAGLDSRTS